MTASAGAVSKKEKKEPLAKTFRAMYQNQGAVNLGRGMADPYVPYLAVALQANAAQLGWLQSFVNLFPAVMQVPWGKLSDFFGRRVPFLIVGGVASFALYFFMIGSLSPWHLIIFVALQMFIGSMMIPTWAALIGDITTVKNRGTVMGRFFAVSSLASLVGTMIAGALIPDSGTVFRRFAIPFLIAGVAGISGSLVLYTVMEQKKKMFVSPKTLFTFSLRSFIFTSDLKENKYFRNLVVLNSTFNFIMSLIWPILMLTYVYVLHATALQIAIMTIVDKGATLFFQTRVGRLLDVIGPMPQILISRFAFITVPIVYAFATQPWHIYLLNGALGFASAMSNVAFFAYILDVAPEEKKGEYFAVYNTMIGIATFAGSIIGGYLAYYFLEYYGSGQWVLALGTVYAMSAFGRAACSVWFFKLKDPVTYPDTLRGVMKKALRRWRQSRWSPI